jgi:hypothetical protein
LPGANFDCPELKRRQQIEEGKVKLWCDVAGTGVLGGRARGGQKTKTDPGLQAFLTGVKPVQAGHKKKA